MERLNIMIRLSIQIWETFGPQGPAFGSAKIYQFSSTSETDLLRQVYVCVRQVRVCVLYPNSPPPATDFKCSKIICISSYLTVQRKIQRVHRRHINSLWSPNNLCGDFRMCQASLDIKESILEERKLRKIYISQLTSLNIINTFPLPHFKYYFDQFSFIYSSLYCPKAERIFILTSSTKLQWLFKSALASSH